MLRAALTIALCAAALGCDNLAKPTHSTPGQCWGLIRGHGYVPVGTFVIVEVVTCYRPDLDGGPMFRMESLDKSPAYTQRPSEAYSGNLP